MLFWLAIVKITLYALSFYPFYDANKKTKTTEQVQPIWFVPFGVYAILFSLRFENENPQAFAVILLSHLYYRLLKVFDNNRRVFHKYNYLFILCTQCSAPTARVESGIILVTTKFLPRWGHIVANIRFDTTINLMTSRTGSILLRFERT